MSLAVGTFSVAQRDAILDELEVLWRQHPEVAAFFDPGAPEPFFVKNLESIQGDERDVVFISVGYGPDADGYVTMGFGPLSAQGGERRLNVLITRARRRCEVFSSITAADIDLGRTQSIGVRVLKTFLQYAETGQLDRSQVGQRAIDSDFEADVGMALAGLGYQVEHQVGVAGFFVDLAIRDPERPGRYLVGVECDGATYHSSRSARDRDRLREQVLRDRGWRIHRVWSADWFRRRHEELQRAVAVVEAARSAGRPTPPPECQPQPARNPTPIAESGYADAADPPVAAGSASGSAYVEASFSEQLNVEPHELPLWSVVDILIRIVTIEGPIHDEEIGRRYALVCGKERTGSRIHEAVRQGLVRAMRENKLHAEGSFYTLEPLTECAPRDRSATRSGTLRRPEMVPPVEIRTGLRQIVADHVGVEPQAAIVEVARMLGFQRTGPDLQGVIEDQLRALLGEGVFVLRNSNRLYTA
jgi:very-short-patch-repair endonuclease